MQIQTRSLHAAYACVLWALASVSVQAAAPGTNGRQLYAPCVTCHQPNAWGSPDGSIPSLAGQQRRYLARQLAAFRSGVRVDTAMQVVSEHPKFGDPKNIDALADYLSMLNANPDPIKGSGAHLRVGQETYTHICAACHGVDGRGASGNRVPRIAGQHYPYLRRQIDAAADLHRNFAPPEMTSALRSMTDPQRDAVADYAARLGSSEPLLDVNRVGDNGK
jgi:cytochrome c553